MIQPHSHEYFMREALREASIALEEGEVPVGAVVVSENRIIARGHNQTERLKDATAHAEMIAVTSACNYVGAKYLPACQLYVTLEPCVMCGGAMYWTQVGELIFGASDPERGYERLNPKVIHPRTKVTRGINSSESLQLLANFFARIRNK